MRITFDQAKRDRTFDGRGVAFEDAAFVFAVETIDVVDDRKDYGELRIQTPGLLNGRLMAIVWTPRGDNRHVMSMRKANDRELRHFEERLRQDRPDADSG